MAQRKQSTLQLQIKCSTVDWIWQDALAWQHPPCCVNLSLQCLQTDARVEGCAGLEGTFQHGGSPSCARHGRASAQVGSAARHARAQVWAAQHGGSTANTPRALPPTHVVVAHASPAMLAGHQQLHTPVSSVSDASSHTDCTCGFTDKTLKLYVQVHYPHMANLFHAYTGDLHLRSLHFDLQACSCFCVLHLTADMPGLLVCACSALDRQAPSSNKPCLSPGTAACRTQTRRQRHSSQRRARLRLCLAAACHTSCACASAASGRGT